MNWFRNNKVEENIDKANMEVKELTDKVKESFIFNLLFRKKKEKRKR